MKGNSSESRIVVIGANGGIGKHVVTLALQQGYHVTAILRNRAKLSLIDRNLQIVEGDILKPETLEPCLAGADVVISAIGKNSTRKTTLYSKGIENLIHAMNRAQVKRAFFISASGLEVNTTHSFMVRFATRYILQRVLKHMYADLERMEYLIKQTSLDWTIVRPPRLTDGPVTGTYRVAIGKILNNPLVISRSDIAHFIVHNIDVREVYGKIVEVAE